MVPFIKFLNIRIWIIEKNHSCFIEKLTNWRWVPRFLLRMEILLNSVCLYVTMSQSQCILVSRFIDYPILYQSYRYLLTLAIFHAPLLLWTFFHFWFVQILTWSFSLSHPLIRELQRCEGQACCGVDSDLRQRHYAQPSPQEQQPKQGPA